MIDFILSYPLTSLIFTLAVYSFASWLQQKAGGATLLNPVVVSIFGVVLFVILSGVSYEDYMQNVDIINFLLGPATVALAIPLYKQMKAIRKQALGIITAVVIACFVSGFVAWFLAQQMDAAQDIQLSIIPKSVTMPIAIGIAEKVETVPSLAVFFVFTTGILGTLFAAYIFRFARIRDDKAVGFALGVTCHGLGVACAFQRSEVAGTYAVLGMSLMGLIAGILMPMAILFFLT